MLTSKMCYARYGEPAPNNPNLKLFYYPEPLIEAIHALPKRIYCNKDLYPRLVNALTAIADAGIGDKIRTWDGCFNIRQKRGATSMSLHSWGCAIDINAAWNQFGKQPTMPQDIVYYFKQAGFDWGGDWTKKDGMHFQLATTPQDKP